MEPGDKRQVAEEDDQEKLQLSAPAPCDQGRLARGRQLGAVGWELAHELCCVDEEAQCSTHSGQIHMF